jgi:uncharacterized protein (DUF362 family)
VTLKKDIVVIVKSEGYEEMPAALRKGINEATRLSDLMGKRIAIKPNLCSAKSSYCGATTELQMVREVICFLNEKTNSSCEIFVIESDSEGVGANFVFDRLDYRSLENEFKNVKLINLSKDEKIQVVFEKSKVFDLLEVPKTLLGIEYLISMAKLKTHVDQRISCVLKNQFGLLPRKHKSVFHPFLSEVLCDLNSLYSPDLCIVDGIMGMEGFGPTSGTPKSVNAILIGTNPIATDIVAAKIIGFKPKQVPHLKLTMKVNKYNESKFSIVGEEIESVQSKFRFIAYRHYLIARIGLRLQKWSVYASNFGSLLQKLRSALATVGFSEVNRKVAFRDIVRIVKTIVMKQHG